MFWLWLISFIWNHNVSFSFYFFIMDTGEGLKRALEDVIGGQCINRQCPSLKIIYIKVFSSLSVPQLLCHPQQKHRLNGGTALHARWRMHWHWAKFMYLSMCRKRYHACATQSLSISKGIRLASSSGTLKAGKEGPWVKRRSLNRRWQMFPQYSFRGHYSFLTTFDSMAIITIVVKEPGQQARQALKKIPKK